MARSKARPTRASNADFNPIAFRETLRKVCATVAPQSNHALKRAFEQESGLVISTTTFQSFIIRSGIRIEERYKVHIPHDELPSGYTPASGEAPPIPDPTALPATPAPAARVFRPSFGAPDGMGGILASDSAQQMGAIPPDTFVGH